MVYIRLFSTRFAFPAEPPAQIDKVAIAAVVVPVESAVGLAQEVVAHVLVAVDAVSAR